MQVQNYRYSKTDLKENNTTLFVLILAMFSLLASTWLTWSYSNREISMLKSGHVQLQISNTVSIPDYRQAVFAQEWGAEMFLENAKLNNLNSNHK